jgi:hypothetical protein
MWRYFLCSLWLALAACERTPVAPVPPAPPPQANPAPVVVGVAHQPKPGERVRQPLLDDHCGELAAPVAFYYHGGRPFAQRALGDGCRPLYMTECADNGECSQSSEQEQGMWCCNEPAQQTAHAEAPH